MSDTALALDAILAAQVKQFGRYTPAASAEKAAGGEIGQALSSLPLNATPAQIAATLDALEQSKPYLFRSFGAQDEAIYAEEQKDTAKQSFLGVTKSELDKFTPVERLELVNSNGKTLPGWLRIARKQGGAK